MIFSSHLLHYHIIFNLNIGIALKILLRLRSSFQDYAPLLIPPPSYLNLRSAVPIVISLLADDLFNGGKSLLLKYLCYYLYWILCFSFQEYFRLLFFLLKTLGKQYR